MKTGVLKWVWCLGLAVGLPSCSGVEEQEVLSLHSHLVVGMTELDKGEYGDVSFEVYYNGNGRCHWSIWEWKRTGRNMPAT